MATGLVESKGCTVDTDDVTEARDYRKVFETLGVKDKGSEVGGIGVRGLGGFRVFDIDAGIHYFYGADVPLRIISDSFVRKARIDYYSVEMLWFSRS